MDRNESDRLELEQAHELLDGLSIDRVEVESLMLLSLKGRIELMMQRMQSSEESPA